MSGMSRVRQCLWLTMLIAQVGAVFGLAEAAGRGDWSMFAVVLLVDVACLAGLWADRDEPLYD